jgi:diguanylate cyclase (GGDEF)-like protein
MRKILIVDDDPQFRALIVPLMTSRGYRMLEAATGKAGTDLLLKEHPDLIVVDGLLPDTDGMTWIQRLRKAGYKTPVIFASAFWKDKKTFQRLTSELGVSAVVQKPVVPLVLVKHIEDYFADEIEIVDDGLKQPPEMASPVEEEEIQIEAASEPEIELPEHDIDVTEDNEIETGLAELQREYAKALPQKVTDLAAALGGLRENAVGAFEEAHMLAHRLHGTAGSYGYEDIGDLGGQVEDLLSAQQKDRPIATTVWQAIDTHVAQLRLLARKASGTMAPIKNDGPSPGERVLVVDDDPSFLAYIQDLALRHALDLTPARSEDAALEAATLQRPDAAVLNVRPESKETSFRLAKGLRELPGCETLPIAFISAAEDMETRISAAHAGGSLFLTKPVEADVFADSVQQLLSERPTKPRVLTLDDDAEFGQRISTVLQREGMSCLVLQEPKDLLEQLDRFRPDLLLLDVLLPKVSGFDICRMLRAAPAWRDLPILFLTAKTGIETRVAAFRAGGDDYLAKPIVPEELLARIQVRLERARLMQERAAGDARTRIARRRGFMARFGAYLTDADRKGQPVSIALIDIDHFKLVNDTHGHLSGDRVLARFGKLLSTRFRAGDLRARWGGEEFMLCFPNETIATTAGVVDRLLAEVRNMTFESDAVSERFEVTFSAGVASFPADGHGVLDLVRAADRRLYIAKRAGRNQVVSTG